MTRTVEPQPVPLTAKADGVVLVSGTRVPLETVVYAFGQGATPEEIAQDYPSLTLAQVYAVVAYYLTHRAAVDGYAAERAAISDATRTAPGTLRSDRPARPTTRPPSRPREQRVELLADENFRGAIIRGLRASVPILIWYVSLMSVWRRRPERRWPGRHRRAAGR